MCCAAKAISCHFLPFQWNHRVFLFVVLDGDTRPRYNHLHKVNESKKKEENAFTGSIAIRNQIVWWCRHSLAFMHLVLWTLTLVGKLGFDIRRSNMVLLAAPTCTIINHTRTPLAFERKAWVEAPSAHWVRRSASLRRSSIRYLFL